MHVHALPRVPSLLLLFLFCVSSLISLRIAALLLLLLLPAAAAAAVLSVAAAVAAVLLILLLLLQFSELLLLLLLVTFSRDCELHDKSNLRERREGRRRRNGRKGIQVNFSLRRGMLQHRTDSFHRKYATPHANVSLFPSSETYSKKQEKDSASHTLVSTNVDTLSGRVYFDSPYHLAPLTHTIYIYICESLQYIHMYLWRKRCMDFSTPTYNRFRSEEAAIRIFTIPYRNVYSNVYS